ncbi:MAG: carbohydrate binding family 9 domain-containing protein [Holophaga sp.]|nr:carbohydrate binding family 9 domain-containing protein [Holophaga sp.]
MTLRALALSLCFSLLCFGAQEGTQSLNAVRTVQPIRMDGRLSEPAWAEAPSASGFTVNWPDFGKDAALPTVVKVLYDDHFLYVGARMEHPKGHAAIIRRLHRRDQDSSSDWFSVYLDSLLDRRTAWGFSVNASGVQRDTLHVGEDMRGDSSWDGVWESSVSVDRDGWTAKLKIPFSLLRIRPGEGPQTWGINFSRADQGPVRETSYWELPPRGQNAFVSRFPLLTGIEGIRPRARQEWIPFISTQRKFETSQPYDDRVWTHRLGLDAHLGLTSHSQLDLSVLPDFGQVEVDQAVLNLGTYETYLPEKRPFFLEGMEIFQVAGNGLLYSRRIGRGLGDPDLGAGERVVDRPQAAEINGAAKYTVKLASGLNFGVLGASVANAKATLAIKSPNPGDPDQIVSREVYPLTNFGVLRIQQALGESGSYVGGFGSFMRQARADGREANVQALDAVYKTPDKSTISEFTLARSVAGTRGETVEGWRGRLHVNRQWRSGWAADVTAVNASRAFDPNDVGYLSRADEQRAVMSVSRRWDQAIGILRNMEISATGVVIRDQAGHVIQRSMGAFFRTDFTNFFSTWLQGGLDLPAEDDRELRTFTDPVKKYLRTARHPWAGIGADTPGNRPWYVRLSVDRGWHEGGPSTDLGLFQSIKLGSAVEVQLNTNLVRDNGERKYLAGPEDALETAAPMVGLRRMGLMDQTLRVSYALSPTFSIQLFSQWLDANYAFREVGHYVDDQTIAPGLPDGVTHVSTAFSDRLWNVNLITRWEFRPGSAFYFVYTHGVATDALLNDRASIRPRLDLAVLRHLPSDDVVQMKISWMFR